MGTQTIASPSGSRQGLARQGSIYSLTLDELQCHLGEPLHSMNLDDLLKNVFAADGNTYLSMDIENTATQQNASSGLLHRQGSITIMNQALNKKTVDEVWKDIQQKKKKKGTNRETLGEMTLEDFLVKAGIVVTESSSDGGVVHTGRNVGFNQGPHWLQPDHQMSAMNHHFLPGRPIPQPLGVGTTGSVLEAVFPEGQQMARTISWDPETPGRKRGAGTEDVEEKTVERRQKRMIKNRESAARSRARKQAYTHELENKVSRLEEENERLRKQKELDSILYSAPPLEPKYRLRRLGSAPF